MRTTVDLPLALLTKAKRLAAEQRTTLSAIIVAALAAQFGAARRPAATKRFKLIVRGRAGGRFPTLDEVAAVTEAEDVAALKLPGVGRRAAP